jgi:hypothetical protein
MKVLLSKLPIIQKDIYNNLEIEQYPE